MSPILIDPLFNNFEPLPRGELRSEVLELADRSGVDVGEVYRVDASRRTTAINAYVGGIGHTKRVVLYDNLIEDYPPDQVRSVVAHELGHVHNRDLPRGLLWIAIVAPAGMLLVQRLAELMGARHGLGAGRERRPGPAALPAVALALSLVSFGMTCAGNALSRPVEARADAFALEQYPRPGGVHPPGAQPGDPQHRRPGPAGALPDAVRHPPHDGGADRRRGGVRYDA